MRNLISTQMNVCFKMRFVFRAFVALAMAAQLTACAKQSFGTLPEGSTSSSPDAAAGGNPDSSTSGARGSITQGANGTNGSSSSSSSTPGATASSVPGGVVVGSTLLHNGVPAKAYFTAPLCQRGTLCLGTFVLRAVLNAPLEFDWHTDDSIYRQPLTDGGAPFGAPNVDYIPTGGHLVFPAGVTSVNVHVQDISPNNIAIRIGVTMVNCKFGGVAIDCEALFN